MLRLFLTKTLVTTTPHFWQPTQNYITKKLGENVTAKSLYLVGEQWQNPRLWTKSAFLNKRKMTFLLDSC